MTPMLAFTVVEIIALLALLAIIAGATLSIAITLAKHWGGASPPPAPSTGLRDLEVLIQQILDSGKSPTPEQCQRMRDLLVQAKSEGVSDVIIGALRARIDELCKG